MAQTICWDCSRDGVPRPCRMTRRKYPPDAVAPTEDAMADSQPCHACHGSGVVPLARPQDATPGSYWFDLCRPCAGSGYAIASDGSYPPDAFTPREDSPREPTYWDMLSLPVRLAALRASREVRRG